MRTIVYTVCLCALSFFVCAQTHVTLKPDAVNGKDAMVFSCDSCGFSSTNFGSVPDLCPIAWTNNGELSITRGLIEFDLRFIPQNASIIDARLSLYHNPTSGEGQHSTMTGPNESYIQRITQSWGENTVTWLNQPTTTTQNQVLISSSSTANQHYLDINVTALIQDIVDHPTNSHGLMIKLVDETPFRRLIFASSDHLNPNLHPQLDITYSLLNTNEHVQSDNRRIYPNPTENSFTLHTGSADNPHVEIINTSGQVVLSVLDFVSGNTIDVGHLPKGIYFIQLKTNGTISTEKLVVR